VGDYGVGKRCGWTRGDGCGDRELSGAAVHVQAVTAEPITTDSSTYEPVTCIMCQQVHYVNGKVLGADEAWGGPTKVGRFRNNAEPSRRISAAF